MSSSADDRKRIDRRKKITEVILIVLLLAAVVGLVIWITSHAALSAGIALLVFLDSETSQPVMASLSDLGSLTYFWI
jgi:flagellar basal body-associated protein FliL